GGESQRINHATSHGSSSIGSMYILDEPSILLHPRDTQRLISVLTKLQELVNTMIVVEHDEEIMRASDVLIHIGAKAGRLGGEQSGLVDNITGDYSKITAVEFVDQNPIGKSTRSNPVTYVKAYDEIRTLYGDLPMSRARKYKPSHFSFNVEGGRCEVCQGEGE